MQLIYVCKSCKQSRIVISLRIYMYMYVMYAV